MKLAAIYILSKGSPRGRLYLDATADLQKRLWAHRHALPDHPIAALPDHSLVYFELADDFQQALQRMEEILHNDHRRNRDMISRANPDWRDLTPCLQALADSSAGSDDSKPCCVAPGASPTGE